MMPCSVHEKESMVPSKGEPSARAKAILTRVLGSIAIVAENESSTMFDSARTSEPKRGVRRSSA